MWKNTRRGGGDGISRWPPDGSHVAKKKKARVVMLSTATVVAVSEVASLAKLGLK